MTKHQRKHKRFSVLKLIIIFAIVLSLGVFTSLMYERSNVEYQKIPDIIDALSATLPSTVEGNIELPERLPGYESLRIEWITSAPTIINASGNVSRPNYMSGNRRVTLTATISIDYEYPWQNTLARYLGFNSVSQRFSLIVKANPATPDEKLLLAAEWIEIPEIAYDDLNLPLIYGPFPDVVFEWTSNDPTLIDETGKRHASSGNVELSVLITVGDRSMQHAYIVAISDEIPYKTLHTFDFETSSKSAYTLGSVYINGFELELDNALIGALAQDQSLNSRSIRLREHGVITTKTPVYGATTLSFYLGVYGSDSLANAESIAIQSSIDGDTFTLIETILFTQTELKQQSITLPLSAELLYIRIVYQGTARVNIDQLTFARPQGVIDIASWLENTMPNRIERSIGLPAMHPILGGAITWTSSDPETMNHHGRILTSILDNTTVQLMATIRFLGVEYLYTIDVVLVSPDAGLPLDIIFIDLGKYHDSDAGEAIYIRYGTIDILIDAGDYRQDSFRAIQETIDEYSEDRIIDYVIATHPHADHIGGIPFVFSEYEVLNLIHFAGDYHTQVYTRYVEAYEAEEGLVICSIIDVVQSQNGCDSTISLSNDVFMQFIDHPYLNHASPNARSVIMLLEAYGIKALFTGDADNGDVPIEASYQNDIGTIDILKVVHHGTRHGTSTSFLEAIKPKVAIITNGNYLGNSHGHPSADAINRIYAHNPATQIYAVTGGGIENCVLTTSYRCDGGESRFEDRNGTIIITIDGHGYDVTSAYFQTGPLEFSSTRFWVNHPERTHNHIS